MDEQEEEGAVDEQEEEGVVDEQEEGERFGHCPAGQSLFSYWTPQRLAHALRRRNCATKIQSVWRGYNSRKRYNHFDHTYG